MSDLLKELNINNKCPFCGDDTNVDRCIGCGRSIGDYFQHMTRQILTVDQKEAINDFFRYAFSIDQENDINELAKLAWPKRKPVEVLYPRGTRKFIHYRSKLLDFTFNPPKCFTCSKLCLVSDSMRYWCKEGETI